LLFLPKSTHNFRGRAEFESTEGTHEFRLEYCSNSLNEKLTSVDLTRAERRYAGIFSKNKPHSRIEMAYDGSLTFDLLQSDVALAKESEWQMEDLRDGLRMRLFNLSNLTAAALHKFDLRLERAECQYRLGFLEESLAEVEEVLRTTPDNPTALRFRTLLFARLKKPKEAEASLQQCLQLEPDPSFRAYVHIQVLAWHGHG